MERSEEGGYKVIVSDSAEGSFYEILDYLYDNYSLDRAEVIADELMDSARSLNFHPERGTLEPKLSHRRQVYRYILYERTSRAEVKIIYYVDKTSKTVYITDFFPTEGDNKQLESRNL